MTIDFLEDDKVDISKEKATIWRVCNQLRGPYGSTDYADIIIPMTVLRRFDCSVKDTKAKVVEEYKKNPDVASKKLVDIAGRQFYNTSPYSFEKLADDQDGILENWKLYIAGYSANVQDICKELEIASLIEGLQKNGRLYNVTKSFSEIDLSPSVCDSIKMGYIFEDLIGRKYQDANAGEQYTGRDIIKMMVAVLLSEGSDDIYNPGKIVTICDQAAGTSGMLSTAYSYIKHFNPKANVQLFGQELNPKAYAIGLSEMLIKDQDASHFMHANTLMEDCFPNQDMRYVIMNPPFGQGWSETNSTPGQEAAVVKEFNKEYSRWGAGLPKKNDGQLLFMQSAIAKLAPNGRAAIIENSSPLFNGDTHSGESAVRRWMLEADLIEAIIALPTDLFYNTGIQTYAWILSKNKRPERRGKVQLIDASNIFHMMRKGMGNKRREFTKVERDKIVKLYKEFDKADPELSKVLPNTYFMYREYVIMQPLQRSYAITENRIESMLSTGKLSSLYDEAKVFMWENDESQLEQKEIDKREKALKKFEQNKPVYDAILAALRANSSDKVYLSPEEFEPVIKRVLSDTGADKKTVSAVMDGLSELDKNAEIQKKYDRKTRTEEVLYDKDTADIELVPYDMDIEDYMKKEVLPYVPDAKWFYTNDKDGVGAEIPFTRLFYKYTKPKDPDELEKILKDLDSQFGEAMKGVF